MYQSQLNSLARRWNQETWEREDGMRATAQRGWRKTSSCSSGFLGRCVWLASAGFCLWFQVEAQVNGKAHRVRQTGSSYTVYSNNTPPTCFPWSLSSTKRVDEGERKCCSGYGTQAWWGKQFTSGPVLVALAKHIQPQSSSPQVLQETPGPPYSWCGVEVPLEVCCSILHH